MPDIAPNEETSPDPPTRTFAEFFELTPPNTPVTIEGMVGYESRPGQRSSWYLELPVITLFCDDPNCGGERLFGPTARAYLDKDSMFGGLLFVTYECHNCKANRVRYALAFNQGFTPRMGAHAAVPPPGNMQPDRSGLIQKLGQIPAFGPHTPSRLLTLVGPERDYFLKGRRAETQGLGIGAFSYYRRVVENQWQRFLDQIISVAKKLDASPQMIADLEAARREKQFSKAVDHLKPGIPDSLRVGGQNPLTLLYDALSDGLHAKTDAECLDIASSIRLVLEDFADRLAQALRENRELNEAVNKLAARKNPRATGQGERPEV